MQKFNYLSAALADRIASAVSATGKAERAMATAIDAMVSEGLTFTDFISPKTAGGGSTASPEKFEEINRAIVLGFSQTAQKLLDTPTKGLSETQKANKRYWQQQIGARRNDFKRALEKRVRIVEEGGTPSRVRTPEQRIRDNLNDVLKVCQNAEEANFDINDMVDAVKKALSVLK